MRLTTGLKDDSSSIGRCSNRRRGSNITKFAQRMTSCSSPIKHLYIVCMTRAWSSYSKSLIEYKVNDCIISGLKRPHTDIVQGQVIWWPSRCADTATVTNDYTSTCRNTGAAILCNGQAIITCTMKWSICINATLLTIMTPGTLINIYGGGNSVEWKSAL